MELRGQNPMGIFGWRYCLDVRRPIISDLEANSPAIASLNSQISSLPAGIKYGAILYDGADIGCLQHYWDIGWDFYATVWDASPDPLTEGTLQSKNYVLGDGGAETDVAFLGDGIVPLSSQRIDLLSSFPAAGNYRPVSRTNGRGDLHVEETDRTADIDSGLHLVANWWL